MSLLQAFAGYNLNEGQRQVAMQLDDFLRSEDEVFILKGYAGTGKTFMMRGLLDYLEKDKRQYRIAAPTGRAAKMIGQTTGKEATTIHKLIYSTEDLKEYKVKGKDGTETFKYYFVLRHSENNADIVYVIDEASMISDKHSEGEFFRFGSGQLLKDFMSFIKLDHNDHKKKLILVGDPAQLPPIGMNYSPALEADEIRENNGVRVVTAELTEVMRQSQESGILSNATKIRDCIRDEAFRKISVSYDNKDISLLNLNLMTEQYKKVTEGRVDPYSVIIAHSNTSAYEYNKLVRSIFFPGSTNIRPGDRILVVRNAVVDGKAVMNGELGTALFVDSDIQSRDVSLRQKTSDGNLKTTVVQLRFREVSLELLDNSKQTIVIRCKVLENLLNSKNAGLTSEETKALYIDFKIRNQELRVGTKQFKDALRADPYFNALQIKFGYALTCHKAQGGEWPNVFLDCMTTGATLNSNYFRWLYTGFTRASKRLYILNDPSVGLTGKLKIDPVVLQSTVAPAFEGKTYRKAELIPFGLDDHHPACGSIYRALLPIFEKHGSEVVSILHHQYSEHYTLNTGGEISVILISYNKRHEITSVFCKQDGQTSINIADSMKALINKPPTRVGISSGVKSLAEAFTFDKDYLNEFHAEVVNKLADSESVVAEVKSFAYMQQYTFEKFGLIATLNFHYNGKGIFTRCIVDEHKTTSQQLANEITILLKK